MSDVSNDQKPCHCALVVGTQGRVCDGSGCGDSVRVIAAQAAEIERLREWNRQMVEKAASGGVLNGYREMGVKLAVAEAAKDRAWALYNHQSEARVAVTAERDAALARATAAEAEAERLRDALRSINGMVNEVATAPMTADRWLDRIEERARDALERKP